MSSHAGRARSLRALFTAALVAGVGLIEIGGGSAVHAAPSTTLVISEFRVRGPNGANDEFIEIQNISAADFTVAGGGTGFAVAASDGVARCVIPNGTVVPRFGHYLCANSVGYSLASYAAGNGTTATGDATYTTDIPDNAGIALFDTSVAVDFDLAHRIDAVGSTSEANVLYKEGTGYPALAPSSIDHSFYRNLSTASITSNVFATATPGISEDTDDNSTDFVFVDTNGTSAGAGQRLGAPGPENLSSPVVNGGLAVSLLDPCVSENSPPNAVRDFTSDPANNSTFGTVEFRRTITNNTGANVTRLRFRIADQRTFPAPSGFADMRDRTSTPVVVTVDRAPCGSGTSNITVEGTTLEQPPSQPNGSAFNSSLSAGVVTLGTPLAPGATIDVRLLFGLQQTGADSINIVAEALTSGTVSAPTVTCLGATVSNITNFCNDPPVGVADSYTTSEDTPLTVVAPGVLANDTDPDLQTLTVAPGSVTPPANGTVVVNADGSFMYTPNADYNGPDSFTYRASDAAVDSADTTVSLVVTPVNDPPVGVADSYTTGEDTPLVISAPGPLANDTDVDLQTPTISPGSVSTPAHGTVTANADGSFTYTPVANYSGPDSFSYRATDGTADSADTTVSLTITAANDPPVAVADSYTTAEDAPLVVSAAGVLANDTDPEGDSLTAAVVATPSHGSVSLTSNGSFTYTPAANYNGSDSFTYAASDGTAAGNTTTVSLTITAVNDAPVAVADAATTMENAPLVSPPPGPLANDTDADGDRLTAVLGRGPTSGSLARAADGSYTYTPFPGFVGTDSFTYAATDGTATSGAVTVTVAVTALPAGPLPATGVRVELTMLVGFGFAFVGAIALLATRRRRRADVQ